MSANVVKLKRTHSLCNERDLVLQKLFNARHEPDKEKATWMMVEALAEVDAHFRLYRSHYE